MSHNIEGWAHGRASRGEDERGGGPAFPVQSGLPPGPRKVGGEDPPIGVCGYGGAVAGHY